jgi:hypothetical protein
MKTPTIFRVVLWLLFISVSNPGHAVPKACEGITKKCTKDKIYTKIIKGKAYTCYDCKQTLCEGNAIVGTEKSSVCEEVPAKSLSPTQIPKPASAAPTKVKLPVKKNKAGLHDQQAPMFDEADSIFGKRTNISDKTDKGEKPKGGDNRKEKGQ